MKKVKAYKVVTFENNDYAKMYSINLACLATYQIGEAAKPPVGKLFAFKTFEDADNFKRNLICTNTLIISGIAENPEYNIKYVLASMSFCRICDVLIFWNRKKKKKKLEGYIKKHGVMSPPVGTITCDSFTPEEIMCSDDLRRIGKLLKYETTLKIKI